MNKQALCALIRMGLSSAGCPSCHAVCCSTYTASPLHGSRLEQPACPLENNSHRIVDEILCNHPSQIRTGAQDPSLVFFSCYAHQLALPLLPHSGVCLPAVREGSSHRPTWIYH